MKKKLYLGTNTKMYKNIAQTVAYLEELGQRTQKFSREEVELFVIPSYTALETGGRIARSYDIRLGAQDVAWEDEGPFTGEVSASMLRETGVEIAEIGHSERRQVLGETNEMVRRKVHAALRGGLTALLCIGETAEQKEMDLSDEILGLQIKEGLAGVQGSEAGRLWIAYEPVWAIGEKGQPADRAYAQARHASIRRVLIERFGASGASIPILYGGSVHPGNAEGLIRMPDINGLFIGRSAWDAAQFAELIGYVLAAFRQKEGAI